MLREKFGKLFRHATKNSAGYLEFTVGGAKNFDAVIATNVIPEEIDQGNNVVRFRYGEAAAFALITHLLQGDVTQKHIGKGLLAKLNATRAQ
jgi:hypothetical protein